jgi:hypothetical protein
MLTGTDASVVKSSWYRLNRVSRHRQLRPLVLHIPHGLVGGRDGNAALVGIQQAQVWPGKPCRYLILFEDHRHPVVMRRINELKILAGVPPVRLWYSSPFCSSYGPAVIGHIEERE